MKESAHAVFRKADARIADGEIEERLFLCAAVLVALTGNCQHHFTFLGEFDRVAEQVGDDLAQAGHIADDAGRNFAFENVGEVDSLFDGARRNQVQ